MWIIPSTHPLYSAFAPALVASKEDLSALSEKSISWPTWKSKHSLLPTWLRAWNRVYWIPHLFSRMLKPSHHRLFITKYTASLADIHASPLAMPANEKETRTRDTFGRILHDISKQLTLFGASSKTYPDTYQWDTPKFMQAYTIWVTRLRTEYTVRRKLARLTDESDFLSLPLEMIGNWATPRSGKTNSENMETWNLRKEKGDVSTMPLAMQALNWTTPTSTDMNRNTKYQQGGTALSLQVKNWPSPHAQAYKGACHHGTGAPNLQTVTEYKNWHTPLVQDSRCNGSIESRNKRATIELSTQVHNGQPNPENPSTHGKNREQLNPAWVFQLMGTTLEKTFYVPLATVWLNKLPK